MLVRKLAFLAAELQGYFGETSVTLGRSARGALEDLDFDRADCADSFQIDDGRRDRILRAGDLDPTPIDEQRDAPHMIVSAAVR